MLLQFTLANYLSYRDERCFSLLATAERGHDNNLIPKEATGYKDLLKAALLYGANASGKSNLFKALAFLQSFVVRGAAIREDELILRQPFRLERACDDRPTSFEVIFIEGGVRFAYGISLSDHEVQKEYLYHWPEGRKATVFERENGQFKFTRKVEEQKTLAARTRPNVPYLSVAATWNLDLATPAFAWFQKRLVLSIGDPGNNLQSSYLNPNWRNYTASILGKSNSEVLALLRAADFGIVGLEASSRAMNDSEIPPLFIPEMREKLKASKVWDINTFHDGTDKQGNHSRIPFSLLEESLGTQRFFEMLGPWLDVLATDRVFLVDEFDTGLHPVLAEYLLGHFLSKAVRSQFIFTTQNTNFLSSGLLRRDQIWITEIEPASRSTDLYSLAELGLRNDHNLEKGYLAGKYGGIPFPGVRA